MVKEVEYKVVPCKNDNPNIYNSLWGIAADLCGGGERCVSDRGMYPTEGGCSVFNAGFSCYDMPNYCNDECDRLSPFATKRIALNSDHRFMMCEVSWDYVIDDIDDVIEYGGEIYVHMDLSELKGTNYIKKDSPSIFILYRRYKCYSDKPDSFNYQFLALFETEKEMEEYVRRHDTKL